MPKARTTNYLSEIFIQSSRMSPVPTHQIVSGPFLCCLLAQTISNRIQETGIFTYIWLKIMVYTVRPMDTIGFYTKIHQVNISPLTEDLGEDSARSCPANISPSLAFDLQWIVLDMCYLQRNHTTYDTFMIYVYILCRSVNRDSYL